MSQSPAPAVDYRGFYLATFVLAAGGWAALGYLVLNVVPGPGPRWLFFVVGLVALTGTAAPFVWYLNRRFARYPAPPGVLMRQAVWVGFVIVTCAWLQLARTLNWATALLLAAGLAGIEWFLRMRERARWEPGWEPDDEPPPAA
ncbi:MAG: hypothetical protein IT317_22610 [Anaerolineales bacterium]|nr:hypothetical protein [Anaerolineales bacterium]